ncbi:unnamed protein product [Parascedosporium putredinis]|uniref:Uncharacterized protein n=1 Tax=Parascedosporium putredinis TaxID=1442378 RepID=A0A9P1HC76_9PEZI|nr:unnamed protein product [Parascedosporium putredinis]CAI8004085.1 unnamed protein product [Parascedosporium putredinis]
MGVYRVLDPVRDWDRAHRWTMSKQLWEAPTSFDFFQVWKEKPQHVIEGFNMEGFLKAGSGADVDEFGRLLLVEFMGIDDTKQWFADTGESVIRAWECVAVEEVDLGQVITATKTLDIGSRTRRACAHPDHNPDHILDLVLDLDHDWPPPRATTMIPSSDESSGDARAPHAVVAALCTSLVAADATKYARGRRLMGSGALAEVTGYAWRWWAHHLGAGGGVVDGDVVGAVCGGALEAVDSLKGAVVTVVERKGEEKSRCGSGGGTVGSIRAEKVVQAVEGVVAVLVGLGRVDCIGDRLGEVREVAGSVGRSGPGGAERKRGMEKKDLEVPRRVSEEVARRDAILSRLNADQKEVALLVVRLADSFAELVNMVDCCPELDECPADMAAAGGLSPVQAVRRFADWSETLAEHCFLPIPGSSTAAASIVSSPSPSMPIAAADHEPARARGASTLPSERGAEKQAPSSWAKSAGFLKRTLSLGTWTGRHYTILAFGLARHLARSKDTTILPNPLSLRPHFAADLWPKAKASLLGRGHRHALAISVLAVLVHQIRRILLPTAAQPLHHAPLTNLKLALRNPAYFIDSALSVTARQVLVALVQKHLFDRLVGHLALSVLVRDAEVRGAGRAHVAAAASDAQDPFSRPVLDTAQILYVAWVLAGLEYLFSQVALAASFAMAYARLLPPLAPAPSHTAYLRRALAARPLYAVLLHGFLVAHACLSTASLASACLLGASAGRMGLLAGAAAVAGATAYVTRFSNKLYMALELSDGFLVAALCGCAIQYVARAYVGSHRDL